jgi:hypothetical protein
MEPDRINSLTEEAVERFISSFESVKLKIMENGENLVNADEVPCTYVGATTAKVYSAFGAARTGQMQAKELDVRTFVPFTAANGKLLMVVLIFKTRKKGQDFADTPIYVPEKWAARRKKPFEVYYCSTSKGFVNNIMWKSILEAYWVVSLKHFPTDKGSVLLLDNLAAHVNAENVRFALNKNIYVWTIPAHTSHVLQPNDNGVNAVAKSKSFTARDHEMRASIIRGMTPSSVISAVLLDVLECAITPKVVRCAWSRTGLFPWDPELIRDLCAPYIQNRTNSASPDPTASPIDLLVQGVKHMFESYQNTPVVRARVPRNSPKCHTSEDILLVDNSKRTLIAAKEQARMLRDQAKTEKEAATAAKKKQNYERKSELEHTRQAKKFMVANTDHENSCLFCNSTRVLGSSWRTCGAAGHKGMCSSCSRKSELNADPVPWCPECECIMDLALAVRTRAKRAVISMDE